MLLLGTKMFHVLSIRTWDERLNHLIKQVTNICTLLTCCTTCVTFPEGNNLKEAF
jgi:hypothetical protein